MKPLVVMAGLLFTVATSTAMSAAAQKASSEPTPVRLVGWVGPNATIGLRTVAGAQVRRIHHGVYRITVRDRSASQNFHLVGPPGARSRSTGVRFIGGVIWTVTFYPGVYRYFSDNGRSSIKGSVSVS